MFGIDQKPLIENLETLRSTLCGYMGDRCDCKFGPTLQKNTVFPCLDVCSEGTGCPEVRTVIELLSVMTEEEYQTFCNRARIILPEQFINSFNNPANHKKEE